MDYRVAFDVASAGCQFWWLPLVGLGIAGVGLMRILYRRLDPHPRPSWWRRIGPATGLALGLFFATSAYWGTYGKHIELVTALESHDYVVVEGSVRVVRDGKEVAILRPGEFFGELSILDGLPRIAQVVAVEPTRCLALASWDFEQALLESPPLALAILRGLATRVRSVTEQQNH